MREPISITLPFSHTAAKTSVLLSCWLALMGVGCSTTDTGAGVEKGRDGTIAYYVEIESSSPGARIEADKDYIGKTPVTWKVFGDKDGTFHNFGSYELVVKAYPTKEGERIQTKVFHTGGWFQDEDLIPGKLFFDMSEGTGGNGFSVDLPAEPKEETAN